MAVREKSDTPNGQKEAKLTLKVTRVRDDDCPCLLKLVEGGGHVF
jgi:hypothetical protein